MTTSTLKALLEKCSPAPWSSEGNGFLSGTQLIVSEDIQGIAYTVGLKSPRDKANGQLIAAARNELPGILAENEKLREALAEIKEIYIGSEGFHAETCPEAYLQMKFRETYDTACEALKEIKP